MVSLPPFTASAMDGWAVCAADTPAELSIVGESAAGAPWPGRLVAGQALRISTGAPLPDGADSVVPSEDADARMGRVRVGTATLGAHVRARGEVIEAGATLLSAGTVVATHAVAGLAATGHVSLPCVARPRVAVLATGSELTPLGAPLPPGAIYDASRVGVSAQARWAGAQVVASAVVEDDLSATVAAIRRLLGPPDTPACDVLVTAGGIGHGVHDHVRGALARAGVEEVVGGVALSPCRPTWLGHRGDQAVLGLPGNQVSAAVAMHIFGRPLLGVHDPWDRTAPLHEPYPRSGRGPAAIRCQVLGDSLRPLPGQGAHAVADLARADALAIIPGGPGELPPGSRVTVLLFPG